MGTRARLSPWPIVALSSSTPAHGEGHTVNRHLRSLRDGRRTPPVSVQPAPVAIDTCVLPACAGNAVGGGKPQVPAQGRQRPYRRQRQIVAREPRAQHRALPGLGQRAERADRQGESLADACEVGFGEDRRELHRLCGQSSRLTDRAGRLRPARTQAGQHRMTQVVAIERQVEIRRVLDPLEPGGNCPAMERITRELEQWPQLPAPAERRQPGHAGDAGRSPSAQQLQQHRFQLVVRVVRGQQDFAGREARRRSPHGGRRAPRLQGSRRAGREHRR